MRGGRQAGGTPPVSASPIPSLLLEDRAILASMARGKDKNIFEKLGSLLHGSFGTPGTWHF